MSSVFVSSEPGLRRIYAEADFSLENLVRFLEFDQKV